MTKLENLFQKLQTDANRVGFTQETINEKLLNK